MSFTTEHFLSVAQVLRKHHVSMEVIDSFVAEVTSKNPRFNPAIFREASTHPSMKTIYSYTNTNPPITWKPPIDKGNGKRI